MRIVTTLITFLAFATPALAQQDVDPHGATHALTGPHRHHHHRRHHVHIPRYVHHRRHFGIALPPGTDRPGRTRTFIPAR
jgi:hypothetical protein